LKQQIIVEIALNGRYQPAVTVWVNDPGFDAAVVACMDVVFAV